MMFGFGKRATFVSTGDAATFESVKAQVEQYAATQRELARARAFTMFAHHQRQIGHAPHFHALNHMAGVAQGYLQAVYEAGTITKDEALHASNAIAIAVNLRTPALMMDVVETTVMH